jgi:outer membrane receptor protein involved in Fe transport
MIKGIVTADNGNYSLPELPVGTYNLKISLVGYNEKWINNIVLTEEASTYSTKDIKISAIQLDVVEVIGDGPIITYEIDKKVINVEDQINTDGQTAIQVLENFPSITVNADGTVSLRGSSSFTLLIDGIPTVMDANDALATIPASTIKEVEIITNPSAKFDAEGTSGVINIITKKSKLEGMSSLINLTAGRFDNYNGDIALNIKKKKIEINLSANLNQRNSPSHDISERTTIYDSITDILNSDGESSWKMNGWGAGAGLHWNPNNSHSFHIRSNLRSTNMIPYNDKSFLHYNDSNLVESFYTNQHNNIDIFNVTSSLFYQYNIKRNKKHYISFKAISNTSNVTQLDTTLSYNNEDIITSGNLYTEVGPSNSYRFNIDYALPLKKDHKFETGVQSQFGKSGDVGKNYIYNLETNVFDFNQQFSSDVDYVRDVHAGYAIFGGKQKRLGYQLGLRAEYTHRTITSSAAVDFTEINRLDWFPSAHFSYNLKKKGQLILSYSRRIKRPRSYFFEPFITWESPYEVRTGNPNLQPEYIGAYELSYIKPIKRKGFFSIEGYLRTSKNGIKRLSFVYEPGVIITQPFNIGNSTSFGLETAFNYKLNNWWKINIGLNNYLYNLTGELNDVNYDVQSLNHSVRLGNTFNSNGWILQLMSNYRSGGVSAQGSNKGSFRQDISLKRSFFKKKIALTLQGRNVFGTARRESLSVTENVTIYDLSEPLYPQLSLTLSIKLNNYQKTYNRGDQMDDF